MSEALDEFKAKYPDDAAARLYFEKVRWPEGPHCPHCGGPDPWPIAPNPQKRIRDGIYHCRACNKQFTVTVGTPMHGTRIGLRRWLLAWYLIANTIQPISRAQLAHALGIGYTSACVIARRIRAVLPRIAAAVATSSLSS